MNNKPLMIILIILILILFIALGAGAYFLYTSGVLSDTQDKEIIKEDSSSKEKTFKANIDDLVLNITNSRGRVKLMKLSFTIKSTEETIVQIVEEYKAELVDIVISLISARSSEELLTSGGKQLLKEKLLEELNQKLNEITKSNKEISKNIIKKILFTTFVMK